MTDEPKRPMPNEFWRTRGGEIAQVIHDKRDSGITTEFPLIVMTSDGDPYVVAEDGRFFGKGCNCDHDLVEHLPLCDGFSLTPPVPAESPEDWVEIDKAIYPRHVPRRSVDVLLLDDTDISKAGSASPVFEINLAQIGAATWDGWKFACRRKDLPPQPAPDPTAVWSEMRAPDNFHPVRLWLTAVGGVTWRYEHPSDRELFFNGKQLFTKDAPAVSAKHTSRSIDSSGQDERR